MSKRPTLSTRLDLLEQLLVEGEDRLDDDLVGRGRELLTQAGERLRRGDQLVVAALAGGTGSGKSSLFNALAGAQLAEVDVRRPTTAAARAWVVVGEDDSEAAGALLDWLAVRHRHHDAGAEPEGLILLDLPDHDSVVREHVVTVDALVERVDVLVWVVDPIKYAQRVLHDGYLRRLVHHAEVTAVVLNHVDALAPEERDACLADLRDLLAADGIAGARILATSARTGEGIPELRGMLAELAARRGAAARRIVGDLRTVGDEIAEALGPAAADLPGDTRALSAALAGAAGVPAVAAAAEQEYLALGLDGSRPVVSRAAAGVLAAPGRVLRAVRRLLPVRQVSRPSRPAATAQSVTVRHTVLELVDSSAGALPPDWRRRMRVAAGVETSAEGAGAGDLARAVAKAVDGVPLRPPRRRWWGAAGLALTVCELVALVGLAWLVVLGVLGWLQLPVPDPPRVLGPLPWPTALLLGGILLRIGGGVARRRALDAGASRHAGAVRVRLRQAVQEVADQRVLAPLRAELDVHARLRAMALELKA